MGVTVDSVRPGDGKTFPKQGDTVTMHYHGTLASNGNKFDSSYDRGSPFQVGQCERFASNELLTLSTL